MVDDHDRFRAGLCRLLGVEHALRVVGDAGTAEVAAPLVVAECPDVVVMDIHLPGLSGIEAVLAGAVGYLLKDSPPAEIANAICRVHAGHSAIAPAVAAVLPQRVREDDQRAVAPGGGRF